VKDHEKPSVRASLILEAFEKTWEKLFDSPIHLDTALSQVPLAYKSILAQILPAILARPVSWAEQLGVGVPEGEPWSLNASELKHWPQARWMAARMYATMANPSPPLVTLPQDFPAWMIRAWELAWGSTDELVQSLAAPAGLSLRASRKIGAQGLLAALKAENALPVSAECSSIVPFGVRLGGYASVLKTQAYQRGHFEIQDEGSQWMACFALWPELFQDGLQMRPGKVSKFNTGTLPSLPSSLKIIDACAGAGGKTLAMADALRGRGRFFAYDTSIKKLQALKRRATRAGLTNIQTCHLTEGQETEILVAYESSADLVLVDAPCSGWGVLRKNPDLKWRQTADVVTRLTEVQARLLSLYAPLVKPQGRLVYGVCTFGWNETREQVDNFLKNHPEFSVLSGGFLGPSPCDGFFVQAFQKNEKKPQTL